jgi:hypothetical protein
MKTIKIIRKPTLNLRNGTIKIYANQKEVGVLGDYQREVEVTANEGDTLWAKFQFCSSNKLHVDSTAEKVYLSSFLSNRAFVLVLSLILISTLIAIVTEYTFFGLFPFLISLYPIYYITIGKNKYLKLSDKEK